MQKQDEAKAEKHYEDFSDQYAMGSDGILTHLEEA